MMTMKQQQIKPSIAIIEDDPEMRSVMVDFLEPDYHILAFSNPKEFVDRCFHSLDSLSLIVSDVHMPEMTGFELLDLLRKSHLAPPVVAISANAPIATELRLRQSGAKAFLQKPFKLSHLLATIQNLVRPEPSGACLSGNFSSKRVLP